jgi:RHS repeat-associated protein
MSIHSHLQYDQSTSHARIPAGGINLIASIDSVSEAQITASFFGSTKALHGENAIPSTETTTHNHSNQQYSITAVTTSAGAIAERYAYSAYGEPTICDSSGSAIGSSAINNRYSYTGREWDATVGLYHFRARWMSPKSGRFLGRDPIGYEGSEWNLYEYCDARPLISTDPSGTSVCDGYDDFSDPDPCFRQSSCGMRIPGIPFLPIWPIADTYPAQAKRCCTAFRQLYGSVSFPWMAGAVDCVANCLIEHEETCQSQLGCDDRQRCRAVAHVDCYARCRFIPYLGMPWTCLSIADDVLNLPHI